MVICYYFSKGYLNTFIFVVTKNSLRQNLCLQRPHSPHSLYLLTSCTAQNAPRSSYYLLAECKSGWLSEMEVVRTLPELLKLSILLNLASLSCWSFLTKSTCAKMSPKTLFHPWQINLGPPDISMVEIRSECRAQINLLMTIGKINFS
jgi:hypothetical protein